MNRVYEVDEGRPVWKLRPVHARSSPSSLVVLAAIVRSAWCVSGPVAEAIGDAIGLGDAR